MTNDSLAASYLQKASDRLDILTLLMNKQAYSDVVREAQEIVELALKGMLRSAGIEPPKFHDVGALLLAHRQFFPASLSVPLEDLARISKWLRKERELSMYGDIDFIPTEEYTREQAQQAIDDAGRVVQAAREVIKKR